MADMVAPWKTAKPARFNTAVGCLECRMTGYMGRTGLYEMLPMSPRLKQLITRDADLEKSKPRPTRKA